MGLREVWTALLECINNINMIRNWAYELVEHRLHTAGATGSSPVPGGQSSPFLFYTPQVF